MKKTTDPKSSKQQPANETTEVSLVGQFFHSIRKDTGKVCWQGEVIGSPEPGWYLVQLFEWLTGRPNVNRLMRIEEMCDWLFYYDAEQMIFSYEHGVARPGGQYQDHVKGFDDAV